MTYNRSMKEMINTGRLKDLTGMKFGRLTVIERRGSDKHKKALWLCKCDCGNEVIVRGSNLKDGFTTSCGCHQKDKVREIVKEKWENEEYRQMKSDKMREQMKEMWKDEEFKQKQIDRTKEMWKDEEFKKNHSGENSCRYNPNLTEEDRQDRRIQQGYNIWKYEVKKQGNFTCDCCGYSRGRNLVSHHLESYDNNKELRTDVSNGVCLCDKCHKEFHHIYGYGNNTKQQYIEFKENKKGDDK